MTVIGFSEFVSILLNVNQHMLGFGFPMRTPSYILGAGKTGEHEREMRPREERGRNFDKKY